jgi:hypothetical protein
MKPIKAFLLLLYLLSLSHAQDSPRQSDNTAVVVPQEVYLSVIVPQSDCPLKIEKAHLLKFLDGRYNKFYQLRNIGNKPISSYTVAIWNSDNTGDIINWRINKNERLLMPNQTFPTVKKESTITIVPLSDELRDKLELQSPMKKVLYFMVLEVEFSDKTKYEAKQLLDSLEKHLRNFEMLYEKKIR